MCVVCGQGLEEQREDPVTGNDKVQGLLERVRELCREQERRRGELEANYEESFTRATQENWTGTFLSYCQGGFWRRIVCVCVSLLLQFVRNRFPQIDPRKATLCLLVSRCCACFSLGGWEQIR